MSETHNHAWSVPFDERLLYTRQHIYINIRSPEDNDAALEFFDRAGATTGSGESALRARAWWGSYRKEFVLHFHPNPDRGTLSYADISYVDEQISEGFISQSAIRCTWMGTPFSDGDLEGPGDDGLRDIL